MVGLSVFSFLMFFFFCPSSRGFVSVGAGPIETKAVSERICSEITAFCSVLCVLLALQQEGLDDGPDFLSEEDRGVSVQNPLCAPLNPALCPFSAPCHLFTLYPHVYPPIYESEPEISPLALALAALLCSNPFVLKKRPQFSALNKH